MSNKNIKTSIVYPILYGSLSFCGSIIKKMYNKNEFLILAYHRVIRSEVDFSFYKDVITSSPEDFDKQMNYISKNYNVISFKDLYEIMNDNKLTDKKYVIITFDDGYKDFKTIALPILKKYGLKATIYITTSFTSNTDVGWWEKIAFSLNNTDKKILDIKELNIRDVKIDSLTINDINDLIEKIKYIENKQKNILIDKIINGLNVQIDEYNIGKNLYMDWDELRSIKDDDIEYGSHSVTHPILTKLNQSELHQEIMGSKQFLEEELDVEIDTFCYPNGRPRDYDERAFKELREGGYRSAVTMLHGANPINASEFELLTLKRITPINHKYIQRQFNATPFSVIMNKFL